MIVIGLAGRSGSGKSAAAAHLVAKHGFVQVALSDALKWEIARTVPRTVLAIVKADKGWWVRFCGWVSRDGRGVSDATILEYALWHDRVPAIRALQQEWGTELRRAENSYYWVNRWYDAIDALASDAKVVVPDVRFPNEAHAVKGALGGRLLFVHRPGVGSADPHESENALAAYGDWDGELNNVGDVDDLHNLVDAFMETVACQSPAPTLSPSRANGVESLFLPKARVVEQIMPSDDSAARAARPPIGARRSPPVGPPPRTRPHRRRRSRSSSSRRSR